MMRLSVLTVLVVALAVATLAGPSRADDSDLGPATSLPRVLSVDPAEGTVNASASADFIVRFSETMDRASVTSALSYADGNRTWNGSDGESAWQGIESTDDTIVFSPFQNLPFSARIAVTLNASRAHGLDGSPLDGNGDGIGQGSPIDDFFWDFATEGSDTTAPSVNAVDPPSGATGVAETASILLTFSEGMDGPTVEDAFSLSDAVRTWTKADGWFSWSQGRDRVTYSPATSLSFDRDYTIRVAATARDANGNPLSEAFASAFRTRAKPDTSPPGIIDWVPSNGAAGVPRGVRFSITFDDPMDRARTEDSIALVCANGDPSDGIPIGDFAWDAGDVSVSFRALTLLDWQTAYRLAVSPGARNQVGLPIGTASAIEFTTAAWTGRVVGRVLDAGTPLPGATVDLANATWNATIHSMEDGAFAFPSVPAGTYELIITKGGYESLRRTVTISERIAGPESVQANLGDLTLQRVRDVSALAVGAGLAVAVAGAIVIGVMIRRRRGPPIETIEEPEDEEDYAEAER